MTGEGVEHGPINSWDCMRLLIVQPYLTCFGGGEKFVLRVAQHYKAEVLCIKYDREKTFNGFKDVKIIQSGGGQGNFELGTYFWNLRLKKRYDIILSNLAPSDLVRHHNYPVISYVHNPKKSIFEPLSMNSPKLFRFRYFIENIGYRILLGFIAARFEKVATNSRYTAGKLEKSLHRVDINVIYPGVDAGKYHNSGYSNYFLFVGRLDPKKRIEYAISAYKLFSLHNGNFDFVLCLSGSPRETYFAKIKKEIGDSRRIKVLWNTSDKKLYSIYSKCTALLFTSKDESFGLVPLEAMASSKPVIAMDEGGPTETIINGKTGFLVASCGEMSEKMGFLADHPKILARMGRASREHVERDFSWDQFFKKLDKLIYNVLKAAEPEES